MTTMLWDGPNFSGRTNSLRTWVGLPNDTDTPVLDEQTAYVGPDAATSLSGIAPTVASELELQALDAASASKARAALVDLGFEHLLGQNPFTLSGGETVVVAVLAAAARQPKRLALDCALEQLDRARRLTLLAQVAENGCEIRIVDNRWREWWTGQVEPHVVSNDLIVTEQGAVWADLGAPTDEIYQSDMPGFAADVEIEGLEFAYERARPVFRDFDLRLASGRNYLLRGPNGCGKSTLSKLLCGLLRPTAGEIRVNGMRVEPWKTPGRYVGYHFQNPDFQLFGHTVAQQFDGALQGGEPERRALGCTVDTAAHPLDLPFAMRKRVAVAATLARRCPVTILDEPTLCQDDRFVADLRRKLRNSSAVVISHSTCFDDFDVVDLG